MKKDYEKCSDPEHCLPQEGCHKGVGGFCPFMDESAIKITRPTLKNIGCYGRETTYDGCADCPFEKPCLNKRWENLNKFIRWDQRRRVVRVTASLNIRDLLSLAKNLEKLFGDYDP